MTAGRTTEQGGLSGLKDELEVIEEIEDGQHWLNRASPARELKSEDSQAELLIHAGIKLPEAAAE